jgi:thiol-disulfide isomerase/thioredoxin
MIRKIMVAGGAILLLAAVGLTYRRMQEPVITPASAPEAEGDEALRPVPAQATQPKNREAGMAQDFTLQNLAGKNITLSGYRGRKVVILEFWATWCGPCRLTMATLQKFGSNHSQSVEVLSINQQEDPKRVADFIKAMSYTSLHVLLDKDGAVSAAYRVHGIPTMYVIDKEGLLRQKMVGYRPDLESILEQVVGPMM